jgi:hypothetical protein
MFSYITGFFTTTGLGGGGGGGGYTFVSFFTNDELLSLYGLLALEEDIFLLFLSMDCETSKSSNSSA